MIQEAKPKEVKGADSRFVKKVNDDYEEVKPFLKESGYDVDNATTEKVEKYINDLFGKIDADEELQGLYRSGKAQAGNDLYNQRYAKTFQALDKMWDKFSTDDYVKKAPYGYID